MSTYLEPAVATAEEISEMKKEIKRLVNKRAIYVASKLSGTGQDITLKACDIKCNKIDAELAVIKGVINRTEAGIKVVQTGGFRSEFVENSFMMSPESVARELEGLRTAIKDEVSCK